MLKLFAAVLWMLIVLAGHLVDPSGLRAGEPDRNTEGDSLRPYSTLVIAETRAAPQTLAALQRAVERAEAGGRGNRPEVAPLAVG